MSEIFEKGPVFPYPLRPSEFVQKEGVFRPEKRLELSETEKKELLDYESVLFEELKQIKEIGRDTYEVYVGALLTDEGQRMVEVIYNNGEELKNWTKQEMVRNGLDTNDKDLIADVYEAVFQDIFGQEKQEDEGGVTFKKFAEIIKEKTGKDGEIKREVLNAGGKKTEGEVVNIFSGLELKAIPYRWRRDIHDYSAKWARDTIKTEYKNSEGEIEKVENLRTVCRLENSPDNKERLEKLKEFKRRIKGEQLMLNESDKKTDEAKVIVLDIYRKYVNQQIADDLLLWGMAGVDGKDIFKPNERQTEGLDKFIYGVDEGFDEKGNRNVLTEWMRRAATEIENRSEATYEEQRINADEAILVTKWLLKEYDFDGEWEVAKRKSCKGTIGILPKAKKINIPNQMDRGLVDFLATISHEVEGHILSHENSKALKIKLKIMEKYSAGGRDSILEEAGAKYVEDMTRKWITGKDSLPESIYFRGLELKKKGGTFRDCLGLIAKMRAKKIGKENELFMKENVFEDVFGYAYDRAMRLFREHTPLDDNSGRITTSDQLKYLEQSRVTEVLNNEGLEKVLFVNGFDLYSVKQLLELGVMDETKVNTPKMAVMNKLWPVLEREIKTGKTIIEIMQSLE